MLNSAVLYGMNFLLILFAVYLLFSYFDIFFKRRKGIILLISSIILFGTWQIILSGFKIFPIYVNISITSGIILFIVMYLYEGEFWNKCIFAIIFNAMGMLLETLSNYTLVTYFKEFSESRILGSLISKILLWMVIIVLKKVFTKDEIKQLPVKYSIMLVLIPTGSIYIMNNIFMFSYGGFKESVNMHSSVMALVLLGINTLIFYIYLKLEDDMQLRRKNAIYEQQLHLCEKYQQERELSALQIRDIHHNMKNSLVSILAYAEKEETKKIIEFVNEIMEDGGLKSKTVINSGNMVIDSLIGYWASVAEKAGIEFVVKINIPMIMPFKGADICLILGNLLENAVEATQKVEREKCIRMQMKYDKSNLLIFVENSYNGYLIKAKNQKLKSTKEDAENHGVGLLSVERVVSKYHGTVCVDDSVTGWFSVRVVLYGKDT